MAAPDTLRYAKIPLTHGSRAMPALGFGTLIPDPSRPDRQPRPHWKWGFVTSIARNAIAMNRRSAMPCRRCSRRGQFERKDVFVTTKLWNNNHRPERVKPAFEASRRRLQVDYVDCYLIHTPFAFQPGDEQEPRDERGQVIYDSGVTLVETWRALERLVDEGQCRAIGLSNVNLREAARDR